MANRTGIHNAARRRTARVLALPLVLALLWLPAGCGGGSSQPDLPDFPEYENAEAFLQMQERLRRHEPEQPQPYPYTDRNEVIYDNLRDRLRAGNARLEWEARQRALNRNRGRAVDQAEFEAMQRRLARDQALEDLHARQRAENGRAFDAGSRERYERYQSRLEQLARQQEEIARERELNRYRHQQQVEGAFQELEKSRELTLRLQQQEQQRLQQEQAAAQGQTSPATEATPAP